MRKILFVDDEPPVLDGLLRMLRPRRHEWEVAGANSGLAALEKLSAQPFDIVVTDMRMPGMDGVQLLTEVRARYPHIVRLVLSGYSDLELTKQSVKLAHQYLSKPCDSEVLVQTLQRVCALHDLLTNEALKRLVSQLQSLPALPHLYLELTRELESPDASIRRIGEIVAQDPAMTAKMLQIINSAFFGLQRHISNPGEAASFLGVDMIQALVLTIQVFSAFQPDQKLSFSLDDLWGHSLRVGQLAKTIAKAEKQPQALVNEAYTAGLLHEIGSLILASKLPQEYAEAGALAQQASLPMIEAERQVLGVAHPEVGAYLLGLWGLPDTIVEAVAFPNEPSRCLVTNFTPLTAVHVADHLVSESNGTAQHNAHAVPLDQEYLVHLGLSERVSVWREKLISANN